VELSLDWRRHDVIAWPARVKPPAGPPWSVTDDDRRRRPKTPESITIVWPPTLCVGGPVINWWYSVIHQNQEVRRKAKCRKGWKVNSRYTIDQGLQKSVWYCSVVVRCKCVCKVERLLYRGADQFSLDKQQRSVLDVACEFGHSSVSSHSSPYLLVSAYSTYKQCYSYLLRRSALASGRLL